LTVLRDNAEALELIREGLKRNRLQIQFVPPSFEDEQFSLSDARTFCRLFALTATLARHEGESALAARAVNGLLRLGQLVASSGLLVQFLVGVAIQGVAVTQASDLVSQGIVRGLAEKLFNDLDLVLDNNALTDVLRREFCFWAIPVVEQMPADGTLAELVDKLIEFCYPSVPMLVNVDDDWKDDGRLARRREEIMILLQDHPHPWNAVETVRMLNSFVSDQIAALNGAESPPAWPDSITWWPTALSPMVGYDYLGDSAEAKAARSELSRLMEMPPESISVFEPLTVAGLLEHQAHLRTIDNPIGRLLAAHLCPSCASMVLRPLADRVSHLRDQLLRCTD
jgi:hypothetical protein